MSESTGKIREPIPGYILKERIGVGGYGEVWSAQAPGDLSKAVKLVTHYPLTLHRYIVSGTVASVTFTLDFSPTTDQTGPAGGASSCVAPCSCWLLRGWQRSSPTIY